MVADAAESPIETTLHAVVAGRVQGVGFRYFVQRRAEELKLAGLVRNRPEGTVEVWARGDRKTLERFIEFLRKGPLFSRVTSVELEWEKPLPPMEGFGILRD